MDLTKTINALKANTDIPISCDNQEFKDVIATHLNQKKDNFNIYSCKEQALFSLLHSLHSNHLYIYAPSHTYYAQTANKCKKSIECINRFIELESQLLPNSIVLFSNPSFPDGNYYELNSLLEYWESQNITVIIDETYLLFTSNPSLKNQIDSYKNLFILQELAPFYGIENLHLTIIHSDTKNLEDITNTTPSCHIAPNEQTLFLSALKDLPFTKISSTTTLFNRELLINEMKELDFIQNIYPSQTNYFLFSVKSKSIQIFIEFLTKNQIKITHCKNLEYLDKSFFSIVVPKNQAVHKLIRLFKNL
jgi:threonine-phosphate decarboxylase